MTHSPRSSMHMPYSPNSSIHMPYSLNSLMHMPYSANSAMHIPYSPNSGIPYSSNTPMPYYRGATPLKTNLTSPLCPPHLSPAAAQNTIQIHATAPFSTPKQSSIDPKCICCEGHIGEGTSQVLSCGHIFHKPCIAEWFKLNQHCPMGCQSPSGKPVLVIGSRSSCVNLAEATSTNPGPSVLV